MGVGFVIYNLNMQGKIYLDKESIHKQKLQAITKKNRTPHEQ